MVVVTTSEIQRCDNVVATLSDVATKIQPKPNVVTTSCASWETWENGKKPNIGPILVRFDPNLAPKKLFRDFYLYRMLYIVTRYYCMQFQQKLMNQTWEKGKKKLVLCLILTLLAQIWTPKTFFVDFISIRFFVSGYNYVEFQGKLVKQTWENDKKPSFGPDFGHFGPNLGLKTFFRRFYLY